MAGAGSDRGADAPLDVGGPAGVIQERDMVLPRDPGHDEDPMGRGEIEQPAWWRGVRPDRVDSDRDHLGEVPVHGRGIGIGGADRLVVRGVTYGTFAPNPDGDAYPDPATVDRDFAQMVAVGINAVRTYTTPPRWLLDLASAHGIFVMAGIAWEHHVAFLDHPGRPADIERRVRAAVRACAGHPAILCYSVGNEIPASIVRWHGRR